MKVNNLPVQGTFAKPQGSVATTSLPDLFQYRNDDAAPESKNLVSQHAVYFGDQWFIPLNILLSNPDQTVQECRTFNPVKNTFIPQVNIQKLQPPVRPKDEVQEVEPRFKWSQKPSEDFARVVTLLGISSVKPKAIHQLFPRRYNLTPNALGSHLQKYKLRIQKRYDLAGFEQIKNWMLPIDIMDDVTRSLANRWSDPKFDGFTEEQILHSLSDL